MTHTTSHNHLKKTDGFTIIELLVVISIIALLIAILLPSLAGARDRARYIKWAGYSHSLRSDVDGIAYYNMEQQGEGDELWNRAALDPNLAAKEAIEPEDFNMTLDPANSGMLPDWVESRWKGKGALDFDTQVWCAAEDVPDAASPVRAITVFYWGKLAPTAVGSGYNVPASVTWHNGMQLKGLPEIGANNGQNGGWMIFRNADDGRALFRTGHLTAYTDNWVDGFPTAADQNWEFYVFTWSLETPPDTGTSRIYLNGKLANAGGNPNPYTNQRVVTKQQDDTPLTIGARGDGAPGNSWDGLLDEVGVFKRAFSEDQIVEMHSVGKTRKKN